jgi:hypothetical protein
MKKEKQEWNKRGMLGNLIGGFVVILIGVAMIPVITKQLDMATQAQMNVTGGSSQAMTTLLKLTPIAFALAILGVGVATVYGGLRNAGLVGGKDISEPTEQELKVARRKRDEEEREQEFVYKPNYKSPEYEYEDETPSKPAIDPTIYEEKKKAYDEKMKSFNKKKKLSEKDLEKNL